MDPPDWRVLIDSHGRMLGERCCKLTVYDKSVGQVMTFECLAANIASNLKEEVQAQATSSAI